MHTTAVAESNGLDIPYAPSALLGAPPGVQRRAAGGGDPDQSAGLAAVSNAAKNLAVLVLNDVLSACDACGPVGMPRNYPKCSA